jgi:hypothetical protein
MGGVFACLAAFFMASPAMAALVPTEVDTSHCADPDLSQPFLEANDSNWYTLTQGQSVDMFTADGWTLSNGASVVKANLAKGNEGSVLDLPSGATAVSPVMCVDSTYKTARTMVKNVDNGGGIKFSVSYAGTKTWEQPKATGQYKGDNDPDWTLSNPVNLHPDNKADGWQLVRFTFVAGGKSSEFQIYNFYVDPRMKG